VKFAPAVLPADNPARVLTPAALGQREREAR